MGGVGGHQVGIDEVSELLTAAAKTLNYETWGAENLVTGFDDTFGFTVELERLTRHIHGETEEMRLRGCAAHSASVLDIIPPSSVPASSVPLPLVAPSPR